MTAKRDVKVDRFADSAVVTPKGLHVVTACHVIVQDGDRPDFFDSWQFSHCFGVNIPPLCTLRWFVQKLRWISYSILPKSDSFPFTVTDNY